ncbi:type 2 periplasmic-binding domain-containing protein [Noviherbaspirillum galbum]|uniref:Transporter substrate-binding domain-containing protein n=1 Tax=Noviherbaspirillum galbum TaxID=2709383 RepID=A0A6B3SUA0_9BURK|nr:transporter substrate-binding domain-containing protein [Noviherbaspirillum galbum]NEX62945.1 transporter substrate-binding domain-containing protein [Noviherbaspirillum galbum]
MSSRRFRITALVLTGLLAAAASACGAAEALEQARQRGRLLVAIDAAVPEYKAGTKFRTPEAIDQALAGELAKGMGLPLTTLESGHGRRKVLPRPDLVLTTLSATGGVPAGHVAIPTGYAAAPMAIMRSDTTIRSWEALKGRKVCVTEGGNHAGTLAARYGAVEMPQRAPADSLIALRTGACDAAVHDDALLEELLKMPEWKKFSARLRGGPSGMLAFVVPAGETRTIAALKKAVNDWSARRVQQSLLNKAARSIAFEVYLDQDVPDCH